MDGIGSVSTVSRVYVSEIQFQGMQVPDADVKGVSDNYQETTGRKLVQGRFFESADFEEYRPGGDRG